MSNPFMDDANLVVLPQTAQLRSLHTIMRNRDAVRAEFVAAARRIMQPLIEEALNQLPFVPHAVRTPIGHAYDGLRLAGPLCGVSVVRAGESMENVLREMVPGVPIGKILLQRNSVTKRPTLYYTSLPPGISDCHVLLFEPMIATGGSVVAAIDVLLQHGVPLAQIVVVNLLTVSDGIAAVRCRFPTVRLVTSAIDAALSPEAFMVPGIGDFGDRFFGTDVLR